MGRSGCLVRHQRQFQVPEGDLRSFRAGRSARIDNFKRATVWSGRRKRVARVLGAVDKGQAPQVEAFVRSASETRRPMPNRFGFARRDHPGDLRCRRKSGERATGADLNTSRLGWYSPPTPDVGRRDGLARRRLSRPHALRKQQISPGSGFGRCRASPGPTDIILPSPGYRRLGAEAAKTTSCARPTRCSKGGSRSSGSSARTVGPDWF